jgi:hypothetical protein
MTTIDTFPAYTIVKGSDMYEDGDVFAIGRDTERHGRLYDFYKLGSVANYAARYGDDVEAAVKQAKERGEEMYWANPQGAMITSHKQDHRIERGVSIGDEITFRGMRFRIEAAANNNVKLVAA